MCPDKKKLLVRAFTLSGKCRLLRWRLQSQPARETREMKEKAGESPHLQRGAPVCFATVNSTLALLDLIK